MLGLWLVLALGLAMAENVKRHEKYIQLLGPIRWAHLLNDRQLIVASELNLVASVNPNDVSDVLWRRVFEHDKSGAIQTVHVDNQLLFVVFARKPQCLVLDANDGSLLWQLGDFPDNVTGFRQSIYTKGRLWLQSNDGSLFSVPNKPSVSSSPKSPLEGKSSQFLLPGSGDAIHSVDASGSVQSLGRTGLVDIKLRDVGERCFVDGDMLVCPSGQDLTVHTFTDGSQRTRVVENAQVVKQWVCRKGICASMTHALDSDSPPTEGFVVRGKASQGMEWWISADCDSQVEGQPLFAYEADGYLLLVLTDLQTLVYRDCGLVSRSDQSLVNVRDVAIVDGLAVFATEHKTIVAFDYVQGQTAWTLAMDSAIYRLLHCAGSDLIHVIYEGTHAIDVVDVLSHERVRSIELEEAGSELYFDGAQCVLHYGREGRKDVRLDGRGSGRFLIRVDGNGLALHDSEGTVWTKNVGSADARILRVFVGDGEYRSDWVILANRSVATRHMVSEIVSVLAYSAKSESLFVYMLDIKTGRTVFAARHHHVGAPSPLITAADNWFAYAYQLKATPANEQRWEIQCVSLVRDLSPKVTRFVLPFRPTAIAVTRTLKSITTRSLLVANAAGHILRLGWDPAFEPDNSAVQLITPPDQAIVNSVHLVRRCTNILSAPHSGSESRAHLIAYGLDLYTSVILPSGRSFDSLSRHDLQQKSFIASLLVGLVTAGLMTRWYAQKCMFLNAWS